MVYFFTIRILGDDLVKCDNKKTDCPRKYQVIYHIIGIIRFIDTTHELEYKLVIIVGDNKKEKNK